MSEELAGAGLAQHTVLTLGGAESGTLGRLAGHAHTAGVCAGAGPGPRLGGAGAGGVAAARPHRPVPLPQPGCHFFLGGTAASLRPPLR